MMMKFKLNTLIFIAGPSGAGKSTLAKHLKTKLEEALEHELDYYKPNVAILSSDEMRQELLGHDYHKHAPIMLQPSRAAFELLHEKCTRLMKWPIAAQFIIVDATNLSEGNRKAFLDRAKENHYSSSLVVLDYKSQDEFEKGLDFDLYSKRVVHKHIRKLRKDFYPGVKRRDFADIYKLRKKGFDHINVEILHLDLWKKTWLPDNVANIFTDIHGCFTEFKEALNKSGYSIENGKLVVPEDKKNEHLILLGDLIDKGPESPEMIDFVYDNLHHFIVVEGNHENFIWRWFHGKVEEGSVPQEVLDTYFTCTAELKDDQDRVDKFTAIWEAALPFVRTTSFFACHAPSEDKFLGKIDGISLTRQRNNRLPRHQGTSEEKRKAWEEELQFWFSSAESCHPWQFAGHIPLGRVSRAKNKYLFDGGCPHGGKLNYAKVVPGYRVFINSINKITPTALPEKQIVLFPESKRSLLKASDLDYEGQRRLKWLAAHQINFISGTMSPADKDLPSNELESLEQGLNYYKAKEVTTCILQHKYMGSRCSIYLNLLKPEESFATSRGGFKIRRADIQEDLGKLFNTEIERVRDLHPGQEWVILDGELLPWSALGKGLVEQTFKPIGHALKTEHDYLVKAGFETLLGKLHDEISAIDFKKDVSTLKKAALIEKYGQHTTTKYKGIATYRHVPLADLADKIETYNKQIELYGQDGPLLFKGFACLKDIAPDGTETTFFDSTNEEVFNLTGNKDPYLVVDLSKEEDWVKAREFYHNATTVLGMEGVVIKPEKVYNESTAPYLKVRNHDYLTIIYGYDFKEQGKYEKLIGSKSIHKKIRTSIAEFEIGKKMLEIPRADISLKNEEYCDLVAQMINQEKTEASLDPRL